jgi:hypothetical protein
VAVALGGLGVRRGAEHGIGTRWGSVRSHASPQNVVGRQGL